MTNKENEFLHVIEADKGRIRRICRNYSSDQAESDDLFQDVLFHLWKSFDSFRGESSRSTWVFRVTLYTCMDYHRKAKRQNEAVDEYQAILSLPEEDREPRNRALHYAIGKLRDIDRAIMLLYLEERSYAEIASILGISASNVGVRITRAKTKLKEIMEKHEN